MLWDERFALRFWGFAGAAKVRRRPRRVRNQPPIAGGSGLPEYQRPLTTANWANPCSLRVN